MPVLALIHQDDAGSGVFGEAVRDRGGDLAEWNIATGGLPPIGEPKLDAARARIMDAMKAAKWAPLHSANVDNIIDLIKAGVRVTHGTSDELTNKGRAFTKRQMPY